MESVAAGPLAASSSWRDAPSSSLPTLVDDEGSATVRFAPEIVEPRDPEGEDVFFGNEPEPQARPGVTLANIAGVKLHDAGMLHEADAGETHYTRGERVVVESDRGPVLATVAIPSRRLLVDGARRRILRRANAEDLRQSERNVAREREAYVYCKERIRARNMPLKLIRAEYPLQGQKLLVYFASEERIDFRDLVKDVSARLHARVEMRQVGVRDEAKMVGGIGSCGRELCCSTFLPSFAPVSIKMAKDQNLVLNPTKVAGQCGRLKCCLVYEQSMYQEMRKGMPKVGKRVRTPNGDAKVVELDVLRRRVRVWFDAGGYETFPGDDVQAMFPSGSQPERADADDAADPSQPPE